MLGGLTRSLVSAVTLTYCNRFGHAVSNSPASGRDTSLASLLRSQIRDKRAMRDSLEQLLLSEISGILQQGGFYSVN